VNNQFDRNKIINYLNEVLDNSLDKKYMLKLDYEDDTLKRELYKWLRKNYLPSSIKMRDTTIVRVVDILSNNNIK
jgi:hypothetical protein